MLLSQFYIISKNEKLTIVASKPNLIYKGNRKYKSCKRFGKKFQGIGHRQDNW